MKFLTYAFTLVLANTAFAKLAPYEKNVTGGKLIFIKESSMTPEQFSKTHYNQKPDAALLQSRWPLLKENTSKIMPQDIDQMTQEEIDQLYIRASSGPIVPGKYKGSVLQKNELAMKFKRAVSKKYKNIDVFNKEVCGETDFVECVAEFAWKGKRIYSPDPETGEYQLRNAISKRVGLAVKGALRPLGSHLDPQNWILRTLSDFYGESKLMIFPARVYCGQSLFEHRRESIIIDYARGRDFSPFIKGIDDLAGPDFLGIRDEIRMIRPGLYLGRAYLNKIFLLNFVLHNPEAEVKEGGTWPANACYDGHKNR